MGGICCYGIVDKDGSLWFDDFDTKEEADAHCGFINTNPSIYGNARPFKVIAIKSTEQS